MASEADTRHGPLGILLAQARAEKFMSESHFIRMKSATAKSNYFFKSTRVLRHQKLASLMAKRRWVAGRRRPNYGPTSCFQITQCEPSESDG